MLFLLFLLQERLQGDFYYLRSSLKGWHPAVSCESSWSGGRYGLLLDFVRQRLCDAGQIASRALASEQGLLVDTFRGVVPQTVATLKGFVR